MKTRNNPHHVNSESNMEYSCLKGLNKKQRERAKEQIKHFDTLGNGIPWGIIRREALDIV